MKRAILVLVNFFLEISNCRILRINLFCLVFAKPLQALNLCRLPRNQLLVRRNPCTTATGIEPVITQQMN